MNGATSAIPDLHAGPYNLKAFQGYFQLLMATMLAHTDATDDFIGWAVTVYDEMPEEFRALATPGELILFLFQNQRVVGIRFPSAVMEFLLEKVKAEDNNP